MQAGESQFSSSTLPAPGLPSALWVSVPQEDTFLLQVNAESASSASSVFPFCQYPPTCLALLGGSLESCYRNGQMAALFRNP